MAQAKFVEKQLKSFSFAFSGLTYVFETQRNFKIQITVAFVVIILAILLSFSRLEFILLLLCISLVLVSEIVNTLIETLVDLTVTTIHPKAKVAKDVSAGVVLLISIFSLLIGLLLFVPHFLAFI